MKEVMYNENTKTILTKKEYDELIKREATEAYNEDLKNDEDDRMYESLENCIRKFEDSDTDFRLKLQDEAGNIVDYE